MYRKGTVVIVKELTHGLVNQTFIVMRACEVVSHISLKERLAGVVPEKYPGYEVIPTGTDFKGVTLKVLRDTGFCRIIRQDFVMSVAEVTPELRAQLQAAEVKQQQNWEEQERQREEEKKAETVRRYAEMADIEAAWRAAIDPFTGKSRCRITQARVYSDKTGMMELEITGARRSYTKRDGTTAVTTDTGRVTVSIDHDLYGVERRQVNWSAWGSVGPAATRAYATLMVHAADLIETLTLEDITREETRLVQEYYDRINAGRMDLATALADAYAGGSMR